MPAHNSKPLNDLTGPGWKRSKIRPLLLNFKMDPLMDRLDG